MDNREARSKSAESVAAAGRGSNLVVKLQQCMCIEHLPDPPERPNKSFLLRYRIADSTGSAELMIAQRILATLFNAHSRRHLSGKIIMPDHPNLAYKMPPYHESSHSATSTAVDSSSTGLSQNSNSSTGRRMLLSSDSRLYNASGSECCTRDDLIQPLMTISHSADLDHDDNDDHASIKALIQPGDILRLNGFKTNYFNGRLVIMSFSVAHGAIKRRTFSEIEKIGKFIMSFSLTPNISAISSDEPEDSEKSVNMADGAVKILKTADPSVSSVQMRAVEFDPFEPYTRSKCYDEERDGEDLALLYPDYCWAGNTQWRSVIMALSPPNLMFSSKY